MPMERIAWDGLPEGVRAAVARQLSGEPAAVENSTSGGNSAVAVLLTLADGRQVFVKGMPSDHDQIGELESERRINPHLPACAPRMLWCTEAAGWTLLGYEGITGTWADFTAGSPDLQRAVDVLTDLGGCAAPPLPLPTAWDRWGYYCAPADEALFAGQQLLHTDPAAVNFLISSDRTYLIDWAWAAVGPAWVDPTLWAMRMVIDYDRTAQDAHTWAMRVPAFQQAPPHAVAVLATAEARSWQHHLEHGEPNIGDVAAGAQAWADFLAHRARQSMPS